LWHIRHVTTECTTQGSIWISGFGDWAIIITVRVPLSAVATRTIITFNI
jgi:hypothetical protein